MSERCRECGQPIPEKTAEYLVHYRLSRHVFVWSFMTLFLWGTVLTVPPQWTFAWWAARTHLWLPLTVVPVVAGYFWVKFLRERKR
jgi:hypothetical protein